MSVDQSEYPHECCECGSNVMGENQLCDRCLFDDEPEDDDDDLEDEDDENGVFRAFSVCEERTTLRGD